LTAPMLAVVGFVGLAVSPMIVAQDSRDRGAVLFFPYLQGPRDGGFALQMLSTRANLVQALWFVALAATGLAAFAASRPGTRVAALLPVVLGAAIAVPAMPRTLSGAWVEDRRATEVICSREDPPICLARIHAYALDTVRGPAREALSVLARKLPPAPTRVLVLGFDFWPAQGPQPADTLIVRLDLIASADYTTDELVGIMLDGAGVLPCAGEMAIDPNEPVRGEPTKEPDPRYVGARQAVTAWLLDRPPAPATGAKEAPETVLARQAFDTLVALPVDEQRARVAAWRDAERACSDGDRLELLVGAGETG
jgi:hypothetical protein